MEYMGNGKGKWQTEYEIWQGVLKSNENTMEYRSSFNVSNRMGQAVFRLARTGRLDYRISDDFGTVKFSLGPSAGGDEA